MISVTVFLALLCGISSTLLYFSIKKNLQFLEQQEEMLELLESSLQDLEICRKKIDKKVKIEVFSDDPIVKELIDDIKQARFTVAIILEKLTNEKEIIQLIQKNDDGDAA
jgi:hypothetical protein